MSSAVERFFGAWGITDAAEINAMVADVFLPDGSYADPRSDGALPRDQIAGYVVKFGTNAPGWTAEVIKSDEIDGCVRCTVAFGGQGPDGSQMVQHGQYFADMTTDGKIARLVGFVGTGAAE